MIFENTVGEEAYGDGTNSTYSLNQLPEGDPDTKLIKKNIDNIVKTRFNTADTILEKASTYDKDYVEADLRTDKQWIEASRRIASFYGDDIMQNTPNQPVNGRMKTTVSADTKSTATQTMDGDFDSYGGDTGISDFIEDDYAAEYGLQLMAELQGNIGGFNLEQGRPGGLAYVVEKAISDGDADVLMDLLYMVETYEGKKTTAQGTLKSLKYMYGDLTNFVGLGLLAQPAKKAVTTGAKSMILNGLKKVVPSKATAVGVAEGGAYGFLDSLERQRLSVAGGDKKEIDLTELGIVTAAGGTVGGGLAKTIEVTPEIIKAAGKGLKDFYKAVEKQFKKGVENAKN